MANDNQASSQGEKDDKNTAPGEVNTGGGDFTGRDKTIDGDEVARDKVGHDVYNVSAEQVMIYQYPEGTVPHTAGQTYASSEGTASASDSAIHSDKVDKKIDIFLSYSRKDSDIMVRLRDTLWDEGFTIWLDEASLEPGTPSWQAAIEKAINDARCMVVIMSPASKQSKWVEIEVSVAEEIGRRVFPVLARGDNTNAVLFRLRTTQLVDVRRDYQSQVATRLIPALRQHLNARGARADLDKLKERRLPSNPQSYWWRWGLAVVVLLLLAMTIFYWPRLRLSVGSAVPQTRPSPATGAAAATIAISPTDTPSSIATFTAITTETLVLQAGAMRTNPKDGALYIWIPAGVFLMGSSITDTLSYTTERPQHKVVLDGFWIMQAEVTNAQYKDCVDARVCAPPDGVRWNDSKYANYPVVRVAWDQARTYANWVGGSLPTEAEWEKACRGTDGRIYPWGNQAPNTQLLNYLGSDHGDTMPVDSYPDGQSPYGLLDMAGNVWEWTSNLWAKSVNGPEYGYPYDANDGREKLDVPGNVLRTLRGGSFGFNSNDVRCATRFWSGQNNQSPGIGFRVVSRGF